MSQPLPLVSVICLCYNQSRYIADAIRSVINQDYSAIELIVIDDYSTDDSASQIKQLIAEGVKIDQLILNTENLGMCRSFNKAFRASKGDFIIDLAGDDVLLPNRISMGVTRFIEMGDRYGVHYGNAAQMDETGRVLGPVPVFEPTVKEGDLYEELIRRFILSAPTTMTRRQVLEDLGGYDESLAYEDFDFWIRSSRKYLYAYSDETVVYKRMHQENHSKQHQQMGNKLMKTTLKVCQKIYQLNQNRSEFMALRDRTLYQLGASVKYWNFSAIPGFAILFWKTLWRIWRGKFTEPGKH